MRFTVRLRRNYIAKILFVILGNPAADLQTLVAASIIHYEIFHDPFLDTVLAIVLELKIAIILGLPRLDSFFPTQRILARGIPTRYFGSHHSGRSPVMDANYFQVRQSIVSYHRNQFDQAETSKRDCQQKTKHQTAEPSENVFPDPKPVHVLVNVRVWVQGLLLGNIWGLGFVELVHFGFRVCDFAH